MLTLTRKLIPVVMGAEAASSAPPILFSILARRISQARDVRSSPRSDTLRAGARFSGACKGLPKAERSEPLRGPGVRA
jgi:hypothetical protein